MPRKYAVQYIDELLAEGSYGSLVTLASAVRASPSYRPDSPDYGLPRFAFLLLETLIWSAMSVRSGAVTYYESVPEARQRAMAVALGDLGPFGVGWRFEWGMFCWRNAGTVAFVDHWMERKEAALVRWLVKLMRKNRAALLDLT